MSPALTMAKILDYPDYIELLRVYEPNLASEIEGFHGVEQVLQWMLRRGLDKPPLDLIGQDEFNYDFVVQFEQCGRWLVFGVT